MRMGRKILTILFSMFMVVGGLAVSASAQTRGRVIVQRTHNRPVIVRRYIVRDPFLRYRFYNPYVGYSGFYDPYYYSPYLNYLDQKAYLESRVRGNRSELEKHLRKYRADGYISPKEQRELDDDYKDVQKSIQKLRQFDRNY